jgi:3-hydroxyisobutyrate dehydrogenase
MSHIAFLGLGAMGSRMAANLLKAGHQVTVWNRSAAACAPLVTAGAQAAETPSAAASQADFVIAMVRDDQASRSVWLDAGVLAAMKPGAVAIESSTLSVDWIRTLASAASAQGISLIEAPVSGSRPAAEAGQLVYLVGGESQALAQAHGILQSMGSAIHHVGPIGSGALVKLATNALLGIQVSALAELIGLLQRNGTDVDLALKAIAGTPVWAPVANYLASSMRQGDFRPQFPVALIEKDFGYALAAAGSASLAPMLAAAKGVFQAGIEQGLGDKNMTAVVDLYQK